jgi:CheY-like chemotaxis protein
MKNQANDILIVDDDPVLLSVLSELFAEHGYTVRTAHDGFLALALIRIQVPNFFLSDLNMPRMSGFELLSIVRRRFPSIAAIAMSGDFSAASASPGIAADAFYAKGSGSVFRLIELIHEVSDEDVRESRRVTAPVWIHGASLSPGDMSMTAVVCPECLRVFWYPLQRASLLQPGSNCPHCFYSTQLAIAGQSVDMDTVGFMSSSSTNAVIKSTNMR